MRQRLRVDFAAAHFFDIQRNFFSVLQFLIAAQLLQVHLLNFAVLRPHDFTRRCVHRHRWFLSSQLESESRSPCASTTTLYLDDHRAFVVAKCDVIRTLHARDGPTSLETVVERRLEPVGIRMPQFHCSIFRTTDNDGQFGMECHATDVLRVSIERLNACFILDECDEWNTVEMNPGKITW